jgi:hypothetical protein
MLRLPNGIVPRLGVACLVGLALLCAAGCKKPKGIVTGTVKLKDGTAVTPGTTVTFWTGEAQGTMGTTGADGTYSVPDIPLGEAKVTVAAPSPTAVALEKGKGLDEKKEAKPIKVIPIPVKYTDKNKTDLKVTVEKGTKEFPIVLEP